MSALIVIDLQEDFINGSLAVPDAKSVLSPISKLLDFNWDCVIATKDWHPADHASFAANNNVEPFTEVEFKNPENPSESKKQTVWPVHCVQNTPGAELDPGFQKKFENIGPPTVTKVLNKGLLKDREYYSCFRDTWKLDNTDLRNYLIEKGIIKVFIVGLAYDYCVLSSALDASEFAFYTYIIKEGCKSVHPENDKETDAKLKDAGVHLITIDELHSMGLDVPITNC